MKNMTLVKKYLPQNPNIEVLVPNYKEPILPVNHGGFGWHGLMAYNEEGQLMCHECGKFFDRLGQHASWIHQLSPRNYKEKYDLLLGTKLISRVGHNKMRHCIIDDPVLYERARNQVLKVRHLGSKALRGIPKIMALEYQNKHDSCSAQLLRRMHQIADKYGEGFTKHEAEMVSPGITALLRKHLGSFNKAKQKAKLATNARYYSRQLYDKQLIIEDMCDFYRLHNCWPVFKEYENGPMICRSATLYRYGGIKILRQEAMKLREEQEAREITREQISQYANKIEMELAGRARR